MCTRTTIPAGNCGVTSFTIVNHDSGFNVEYGNAIQRFDNNQKQSFLRALGGVDKAMYDSQKKLTDQSHEMISNLIKERDALKKQAPAPEPTPGPGYRWATEKDYGKRCEYSNDAKKWDTDNNTAWDLTEINRFRERPFKSMQVCWRFARRKIERREVTPTMEHVGKMITIPGGSKRKLIYVDHAYQYPFKVINSPDGSVCSYDHAKITLDENDNVVE